MPLEEDLDDWTWNLGDVAVDTVTLDLTDGMIKKEIEKEEEDSHGDEGDDEWWYLIAQNKNKNKQQIWLK